MKERVNSRILWEAGCLWKKLKAQSDYGLRTGALQSIETESECIDTHGIRFLVRILTNLSRKEKARKQQGRTTPANPFLPYEQDLYVTDISETHLCLLNKFNVVDHHFLIVTRQFESQENWLTLADFEALVRCLAEVNGLAFFNGGKTAGASQPHKHLQVVPYTKTSTACPMEEAILLSISQTQGKGVATSPRLPFCHAIANLATTSSQPTNQQERAQEYLKHYHRLLSAVGITGAGKHLAHPAAPWQGQQTAAYNLLCSQQWMLLVPRSQEQHADISVNALGFSGSLLVKNQASLAYLKTIGPMQLLQQVSWPRKH